ncbi:YdcH family protein [Methylotetracoccus oryzae]|uniref:YdcH family protein n=1 Tax=Methylotetracoccus oryzae TaxID=1919059 RepID=UPI001118E98C|nr:YdcH family protein [Methylotetracoccus oryzae]
MDEYPDNIETETFGRTAYLRELRAEHRQLDELIQRLQSEALTDEIQVRRLKKHKLRLKDLIALAESALIPDLDA